MVYYTLLSPDAEVTFQEIVDGKTPKGAPAFSLDESTAPLAQIYGLGYNDPNTDKRWGHTIIFSYELLEQHLKAAGFTHIERRSNEEDLANHAGIDDDSQNHYTLLVSASQEKLPHKNTLPLSEKDFREKCRNFLERYPQPTPASFVIPVYNEARNLRHFLTFWKMPRIRHRRLVSSYLLSMVVRIIQRVLFGNILKAATLTQRSRIPRKALCLRSKKELRKETMKVLSGS